MRTVDASLTTPLTKSGYGNVATKISAVKTRSQSKHNNTVNTIEDLKQKKNTSAAPAYVTNLICNKLIYTIMKR